MGLVLGVEGDGSHSHAALTDASGTLLGFGANDDSSDWDQNGIAAAAAALRSCITEALSAAGSTTDDVESSVFALPGSTSRSTNAGSPASPRRSDSAAGVAS